VALKRQRQNLEAQHNANNGAANPTEQENTYLLSYTSAEANAEPTEAMLPGNSQEPTSDPVTTAAPATTAEPSAVAAASQAPASEPAPPFILDEEKKIIDMDVKFVVNRTYVSGQYMGNGEQFDEFATFLKNLTAEGGEVKSVSLVGISSPEGSYSHNADLSRERAEAMAKYINEETGFSIDKMEMSSIPENWEALRKQVEESDLTRKEQVLDIIDGSLGPDAKLARIRKTYPKTYRRMFNEFFPELRVVHVRMEYVPGKKPAPAPAPAPDRLSFFAYAPYVYVDPTTGKIDASQGSYTDKGDTTGIVKISTNEETGDPLITYVVSDDVEKSVDLLYAVAPSTNGGDSCVWNNVMKSPDSIAAGYPYMNLIKPTTGQKVNLSFRHALARVNYTVSGIFDVIHEADSNAKNVESDTKITVDSVIIYNLGGGREGTLNLRNSTKNSPNWTVKDEDYERKVVVTGTQINDNIRDQGDQIQTCHGVDSTRQNLLQAQGAALYALPDFGVVDRMDTVKITIVYYVTTKDDNIPNKGYTRVKNKIAMKYYAWKVPDFAIKGGYLYTMNLGLGMTTVKLSADVQSWDNVDSEITHIDLITKEAETDTGDHTQSDSGGTGNTSTSEVQEP